MRSRVCLFVFAFAVAGVAYGRPLPQEQGGAVAEQKPLAEIPFERANGHLLVKGQINGSGSHSFLLDTGAKVSYVDEERARGLALLAPRHPMASGPRTKSGSTALVRNAALTFPELSGFSHGLPMSTALRAYAPLLGHDIDGILGSDFFRRFVVEIDYDRNVIRLHSNDSFRYSGPGEVLPIEFLQNTPLVSVQVAPREGAAVVARLGVDMSSAAGLILHAPFLLRNQLEPGGTTMPWSINLGARQSRGTMGSVGALKIGGLTIPSPAAYFASDTKGTYASRSFDGTMGDVILSRFRLFLDYGRRQMIFEPGKRFSEPAVTVYVGATISAEGRGYRTFRVTSVENDSPAFAAGLRENDVITGIESRPAQELTLTGLLEILNRAAPSSVVVRRGGETLTLTLTPKTLG